jgi:hypothetical protein
MEEGIGLYFENGGGGENVFSVLFPSWLLYSYFEVKYRVMHINIYNLFVMPA